MSEFGDFQDKIIGFCYEDDSDDPFALYFNEY